VNSKVFKTKLATNLGGQLGNGIKALLF